MKILKLITFCVLSVPFSAHASRSDCSSKTAHVYATTANETQDNTKLLTNVGYSNKLSPLKMSHDHYSHNKTKKKYILWGAGIAAAIVSSLYIYNLGGAYFTSDVPTAPVSDYDIDDFEQIPGLQIPNYLYPFLYAGSVLASPPVLVVIIGAELGWLTANMQTLYRHATGLTVYE